MIYTTEIPEPFRQRLDRAEFADAADLPVKSPQEQFARGLARTGAGRASDARADFEAALSSLGDPCRLELAYLDLRIPGAAASVAQTAREIAERSPQPSMLAARGWHIAGLAEDKLRRLAQAADALLLASRIYQQCDCAIGHVRVLDSLGIVQAARGRLADAVHHFALSIAGKAVLGDREGLAISLGNLGRAQLQAGRYDAALDCLQADLQMIRELGDQRGEARVLNDLGRAQLGLGDLIAAERTLAESCRLADVHGFKDVRFFARKDLARVLLAAGRLAAAGEVLGAARQMLHQQAEPYFLAHLALADGLLQAAQKRSTAADLLTSAVEQFRELNLPAIEIEARLALADVLVQQRRERDAEDCLRRGLHLARSEEGFLHFVPQLTEAMLRLGIVEGAVVETGRSLSAEGAGLNEFLIRERLGRGAFGEVYRVYDSRRLHEAALKILRTSEEYDPRERERLIASARRELLAASRVHHPGVAQVWAVGTFSDGRIYVVQELVAGEPLQSRLTPEGAHDVTAVLECLARIACALGALHVAGVIHRDLKPSNVVLRGDGQPVLLDFGIAHLPMHGLPADRHVEGTVPYMSPEQALGKAIDGRSDLYSLGVIAYQWLAGMLPLRPHGRTFVEQARDIARRVPKPLAAVRPDLPRGVCDLVMALLEKKPRRRPQTALEVADLCRDLLRETATATIR